MITLNGLFTPTKLLSNLYVLHSSWPAPSHLRPLTLYFIPFLGAQPKHVEKYLQIYADYYKANPRPLHVLLQIPHVTNFAIQYKTTALVRRNGRIINETLDPGDKMLLHGMSIGCFLHAVHIQCDKDDVYTSDKGSFKDKIVGQVYDSPVYGGSATFGLPRMIDGMTEPISNPLLRKLAVKAASGYISVATSRVMQLDYYIDAFVNQTPTVPTVAITSLKDRLCDAELFTEAVVEDKWRSRFGDNLIYQCFEQSLHSKHLQTHPETFRRLMAEYLDKVEGILSVFDEMESSRDYLEF